MVFSDTEGIGLQLPVLLVGPFNPEPQTLNPKPKHENHTSIVEPHSTLKGTLKSTLEPSTLNP